MQFSISLPRWAVESLDEIADDVETTRSKVVQVVVMDFLTDEDGVDDLFPEDEDEEDETEESAEDD